MNSQQRLGRWAGLVYLIVVLTGLFSLLYVPSQINVADDISATLDNIRKHELLYRAGIAAFLVKQLAFLLLVALLFRLLAPRPNGPALAMVALVAVSVPIALVSLVARIDVLTMITNAEHMEMIDPDQLRVLARTRLDAYRNGLLITNLFWGLWLLPLGHLALSTKQLPKLLGVLLLLGGIGYIAHVFSTLILPGYVASGASDWVLMPAALGEIGTCLWLLAVGGRALTHVPAAQPNPT